VSMERNTESDKEEASELEEPFGDLYAECQAIDGYNQWSQ
jgi:hypothetical protein